MNGRRPPSRFGARLTRNGASFRLWAPAAERVDLLLETPHPLRRDGGGWFSADIAGVKAGARYKFRIDDEIDVPDPASAFQPEDVSGPSELIDHAAYRWRAENWRGRPWPETVVLESHVGTFTAQGTYRAMIERLDHLKATGITALELMPLADFAGQRNWGYDGVLWYAPDSVYGRPDDLKTLIDEAHLRGLMVFLDVVYNHFGPEGNYLGRYAPSFFTDAQTPWGSAIDYRVPEVRDFAIGNALHWLSDYRFDGLRLDAVHAIAEPGEIPILADLSRAVGGLAEATGRHIHLMLENDDNSAHLLEPGEGPPRGKYRAQWNDDYHHAWHVLLTDEAHGYYCDYERAPLHDIARALGSGFVYQGEASAHRDGRPRGEPSGKLVHRHSSISCRTTTRSATARARATGSRPMRTGARSRRRWRSRCCRRPCRCCSWARNGDRKRHFRSSAIFGATSPRPSARAAAGNSPAPTPNMAMKYPTPLDSSTAQSAVLDWSSADQSPGRERLALVRKLLSVRQREIIPRLDGTTFGGAQAMENGLLTAIWRMGDGATLRLLANLSNHDIPHAAIESAEPRSGAAS